MTENSTKKAQAEKIEECVFKPQEVEIDFDFSDQNEIIREVKMLISEHENLTQEQKELEAEIQRVRNSYNAALNELMRGKKKVLMPTSVLYDFKNGIKKTISKQKDGTIIDIKFEKITDEDLQMRIC